MSLDIGLTAVIETTVVDRNMTHNVSGMWREAGIYDALYNSEGKRAKEVIPILEEGLAKMEADPRKYKKMDASNGWGTYEQVLPWLKVLIDEFKKYPEGLIWISK